VLKFRIFTRLSLESLRQLINRFLQLLIKIIAMSKRIFVIIFAFLLANNIFAQDDPTLFTVGDTEIGLEEFRYIYQKNNGKNADFSEASLKEYLNLYMTFKMKVQRARDVQLDTVPALMKELESYRKQLSNNYLTDREIMSSLMEEAYERMQNDVNISHIYVRVAENASPKDTLNAYTKIQALYKQLTDGKDFRALASEASEDESTKDNGGQIGYITALQLPGFYDLESVAYNTEEGNYSKPVRSRIGYHIIFVNDIRPARGQIELAHILFRVIEDKDEAMAKQRAEDTYGSLQSGKPFEDMAKVLSQDEKTAQKGGYIGYISIGQYESAFEEAAYSIEQDGGFSRPFRTSVGWHIVKRVSYPGIETFENVKGRLKNKIRKDTRFEIVQSALVENIKEEAGFSMNQAMYDEFINGLDESFATYQWNAPTAHSVKTLFSLGGNDYTVNDFNVYLKRMAGNRVRIGRDKEPKVAGIMMLNEFIQQEALKYEENQLENKYPEFKALMREYREGILLFEITKQEVWDKSSKDTIGLQQFYEQNKENYKWDERAKVTIYTINTTDEKLVRKFEKIASKKPVETVVKKMNKDKDVITFEVGTYEKGKNKLVDATDWEEGSLSEPQQDGEKLKYVKIDTVLPATVKPLADARGYIIADYQDYLEQKWVEDLKASYPLKFNETVFKTLIK
jgi:peptidyl-prolyl cis-trans isomerase SurA